MTEPVAAAIIALDASGGASLTELARATGRPISTIQRAVEALEKADVVVRPTPRGTISISAAAPRHALRELAEWRIGVEPAEVIVRRLQEKASQRAGKAQADAERSDIRRLLAMTDRQTRGLLPRLEPQPVANVRSGSALQMTDEVAFDPLAIIRTLNAHKVRYVVIGGIAAGVQGVIWATLDLDICHARDRENHARLASACSDLEARPRGLPDGVRVVLDARALAAGTTWTLTTKHGALDLLAEPGAGLDYDTLAPRARRFEGEEPYLVASIDDLIAMKTAAGRPKDIGQVELLRVAADEIGRLGSERVGGG